ncbi:MAG: hypothetical protein K2P12_03130 [Clostridia bacterium]|nr:hypothetical protein [Clostridia bacterium]
MNMFMKDYYNYRAYYCGLCKRIGKDCGQLMRISTNYDMVFFDMFCHAVLDVKPQYNDEPCILSPKKKRVTIGDELTDKIVDINTLLIYYKLLDDKLDSKKASISKSLARNLVVSGKYKKAKNNFPALDSFLDREYARLRQMENENKASIDMLADPFANMLREAGKTILGDKSTSYIEDMFYFLGKWVYIIDAVDDTENDFKNKEFNPFFVGYEYQNQDKFFEDRGKELEFLLKSSYNSICNAYKNIELKFNKGAITNIIWYGILMRTEDILGRKGDCKKIRI